MKKQNASKRVLVMAMAGVMGLSCLVGCNGSKKEQPVTSIQSQQTTPDSKNKTEESPLSDSVNKANDKKSTTNGKATTDSKTTTGSKSTTGSNNNKSNKKGGTTTNNSTAKENKKGTTKSE